MYLITVYPVHHKFGEQCLRISLFDARQPQRLIDRGIGFPVAGYSRGLRAVMHLAGVLQPAPADMFDEATVYLFWRAAPLTPVQNEFCSH